MGDIKGLATFRNKSISLVILVSLIFWTALYVRGHINEFRIISNLSFKYFVILLLLYLLDIFSVGLFTKVITGTFGIRLEIREWFGLSVVTSLANYLLPFKGGAGLRGIYLKKYHDFPYTYFLTALLATSVIILFVNSGTGIVGMCLTYVNYRIFNWIVFATLATLFFLFLAVIVFSLKVPNFGTNFLKPITNSLNMWHEMKKTTSVVFKMLLIALLHAFLNILIISFAFSSFSLKVSLAQAMVISSLSVLSIFIGITPGSLGINEAVIVFSSRLFQITPAQGLLVATLRRIVILFWVFTLGPIFSYILIRRGKQFISEELTPSRGNPSRR